MWDVEEEGDARGDRVRVGRGKDDFVFKRVVKDKALVVFPKED